MMKYMLASIFKITAGTEMEMESLNKAVEQIAEYKLEVEALKSEVAKLKEELSKKAS